MRALLRVPSGGGPRLLETLRGVQAELGGSVAIGVSNVCTGAPSLPAGFEEARHALLGTTVLWPGRA